MENQPADIRAFRLNNTGLKRILGELEADILEAVWQLTAATPPSWTTIGAVSQALGPSAHYKTIQTVMNRLVEKHLLRRRQPGYPYEYQPTLTRDALILQITHAVISGLMQDFGEIAIAQALQTLTPADAQSIAFLETLAQESSDAERVRPQNTSEGD